MILILISSYYLENYAIICIEMVTYPFNPTECLLPSTRYIESVMGYCWPIVFDWMRNKNSAAVVCFCLFGIASLQVGLPGPYDFVNRSLTPGWQRC